MADDSQAVQADTCGWVVAATTRDLKRRRKLRVDVDGVAIALFAAGENIYAFEDACIHEDRSLSKGTLLHGRVICPGHQWQFDLETGYESDQELCQPTYPVRLDDEVVYVDMSARRPDEAHQGRRNP
ncbi:Rieske 2Fe-2S domain-containing protein [Gordonia sp. HY002]|uniref:Rieske (2Fe-2S) protein n=1 Tax=Gordonia zhenghanii TaxID=2911516 RepID=UPI001EF120D3|nr:Rieske 2Fe-2S domain-containing protein [Gordonia zhenghanii]MCF8570976.1 Rieske 2Fe-2S domain-containing protein [Gordonia zhenghanii]MCF8604719.1 Rieske 2Fe-2S domain-containing protein [Gordonia zhenghanii]